ncbi:MAG: hypothetical protein QM802_17435 [Agriterribacter sp.]
MILLLVTLAITACNDSFDKNYYERITGVKLPKEYKVLQTFDNLEWLTGTAFQLDSISLQTFITKYKFDTLKTSDRVSILNSAYLRKEFQPAIAENKNFFL